MDEREAESVNQMRAVHAAVFLARGGRDRALEARAEGELARNRLLCQRGRGEGHDEFGGCITHRYHLLPSLRDLIWRLFASTTSVTSRASSKAHRAPLLLDEPALLM